MSITSDCSLVGGNPKLSRILAVTKRFIIDLKRKISPFYSIFKLFVILLQHEINQINHINMKKIVNIVLTLCVAGLAYICVGSIMGSINFGKEREAREKEIIARLIDIRTAQVAYRDNNKVNKGQYTDNFDELIAFVKNEKLPFIKKVGELTDAQLEDGLTEDKAAKLIEDARKAKRPADANRKWKEAEKAGLVRLNKSGEVEEYFFSRDTFWVLALDTLFPKGFNADSLRYVPFGNGAEFELRTGCDSSGKSGNKIYLFEAKTPYRTYLEGINKDELNNLINTQEEMGRYVGLKVGDAEVGNNNAGNWE
jgi:hypothetical protein